MECKIQPSPDLYPECDRNFIEPEFFCKDCSQLFATSNEKSVHIERFHKGIKYSVHS